MAAFLRTMGVEEQTILGDSRVRSNMAARRLARSEPAYQESVRAAVQGVYDDAETRGVFQSGATAKNAAIARTNLFRNRQEEIAQTRDDATLGNLSDLQRIAGLRQQGVEETFGSMNRLGLQESTSLYGG